MILGPLVAGALFEVNVQLPYLLNVVLLFAAFLIMKKCCSHEKIVLHESVEVVG